MIRYLIKTAASTLNASISTSSYIFASSKEQWGLNYSTLKQTDQATRQEYYTIVI